MAYLFSILLALASLALDDFECATGWRTPLALPLLVSLPYFFAVLAQRAALGGRFKLATRLSRLTTISPILGQFAAIGLFGWQCTVQDFFGVRLSLLEWPRIELLASLAPFVIYTIAAIDAEARFSGGPASLSSRMRKFHLRMFAGGLAPIVAYLLFAALVGHFEGLRIRIEEVGLFSAVFSGVTLAVFVFCLPLLLRHAWDTEPMARGAERGLMEYVAQLANFRCKQLLVWHTGGLMANAAIVGVTPGSRRVFFSDALLRRLGPRELAAVFAHEIGHARQHHIPLFIVWAIAFFAGLDSLAAELDPEAGALGIGVLSAGLALWFLGFGWLSRRIELEADLYSLELLGDGAALTSALDAVSPGRSQKSGWRHFSMAKRTAFLELAAQDPSVGRRLHTRLRIARWLGALLLAATLSIHLVGFTRSYTEDQVRASLRLGHYVSAAELLAEAEGPAEDLAELVELARSTFGTDFASRATAAQACRERALRLEPTGDRPLIESWWLLAVLAGDNEARRHLDCDGTESVQLPPDSGTGTESVQLPPDSARATAIP